MTRLERRWLGVREQHLRDIAAAASLMDAADTEQFTLLLNYVLECTDLRMVEVSDAVQCSEATVGRWRSGQVAPHELIRKVVRDQIVELLYGRANDSLTKAKARLRRKQITTVKP